MNKKSIAKNIVINIKDSQESRDLYPYLRDATSLDLGEIRYF